MKIILSASAEYVPFNKHWRFCVGSGHAALALRRDWAKQLKTVHDELGIERVRFHGIFCDDMHTLTRFNEILPVPFTGRYKELSFRQCAAAYDNVLEAGMKPFVELGFMPRALSRFPHLSGAFYYRPNVAMPKSLEKWAQYVKSFVSFLIDRYGAAEVEQWHFEVWNEPDIPAVFFDAGQKSYFRLYEATARAIKSVNKKIKVGGPATSGSRWIDEFLNFCAENGVPVDFVSTHQYAGDPIGGVPDSQRKKDADRLAAGVDFKALLPRRRGSRTPLRVFRDFMQSDRAPDTLRAGVFAESAANVKARAGDLPVFYTEWNMCAGFSAPCNDTSMQAAYIVSAAIAVKDSVSGSSVWTFSDIFEEFHQFPEEFHGGFGLMTQSGIKKPAYHALKLLGEAGDEINVIDTGSEKLCAAAIKNREADELTLAAAFTEFEPTGKTEEIDLTVELAAPPLTAEICVIDENNASPLKVWQGLGSVQTPTHEMCEKISTVSATVWKTAPGEYDNGVYRLTLTARENSVTFIRIKTE